MQILVTGATGFLGGHVVQIARLAGHSVNALVRNRAKASGLQRLGVQIVPGDLTVPDSLATAVEGCDAVIHAAAAVTNWGPWREFAETTVQGTEHLLRASARAGVERFVYVSTIRVYDDRYCRRHRIVEENAPHGARGFRHFGHYARAKVLAERLVWQAAHELPVSVLRPAWIYGPGDETIVPPLLQYLQSPTARWPSHGDPCVDPIYVTDVATCALAAAQAPEAVGQAYNVAPTHEIQLREFVGELCRAMEIDSPRKALPYALTATAAHLSEAWARITARRSPPAITRAGLAILTEDNHFHSGKAQRELGWQPQVDLTEGVRRTAQWLQARGHSEASQERHGEAQS